MGNGKRDKAAMLNWLLKILIDKGEMVGIKYENKKYFMKSFYEKMIACVYGETISIDEWFETDNAQQWDIRNENLLKEICGEWIEAIKIDESYFKEYVLKKMNVLPVVAGLLFLSKGLDSELSEAVDAAVEYFYKLKADSKENDKAELNLEQIEKLEKFIKFADGHLREIEKLAVNANTEIEAFKRMSSNKKWEINENDFGKATVENSGEKNGGKEINGKD